MMSDEFDKIVEIRTESIKKVLQSKAQEYSSNGDRMHNFNVAAWITNTYPEKALWGMAMKHLISVIDMVDVPQNRTPEHISEKIGDMINYLILLEAMLYDRNKEYRTEQKKEG